MTEVSRVSVNHGGTVTAEPKQPQSATPARTCENATMPKLKNVARATSHAPKRQMPLSNQPPSKISMTGNAATSEAGPKFGRSGWLVFSPAIFKVPAIQRMEPETQLTAKGQGPRAKGQGPHAVMSE